MTTRVRIGVKIVLASLLITILLVYATGSVDFVYTGF